MPINDTREQASAANGLDPLIIYTTDGKPETETEIESMSDLREGWDICPLCGGPTIAGDCGDCGNQDAEIYEHWYAVWDAEGLRIVKKIGRKQEGSRK